jgi:LPS export ABC transporter protein LptC
MDAQEVEIGMLGNLRLRRTALAVLVLAAVVLGCAGDEPDQVASERTKPLPDQVISEFGLTETSMGLKDWHMEADKAYVYEKRNILETEVVEVTFFDKDGSVRSVLKADYAKLNRNTDDMEARGSVVVTGSDGVKLETETLTWQSGTRQIASDDSVTVYRNEDILTGWGFRGDPDLGSFRILRDMKATIKARDESKEGMRGGRDT